MQQKQPLELFRLVASQQNRSMRLGGLLLLAALATTGPGFAQCNSAPMAKDDTIYHTGDPIIIHVLANDEDLDGDPLEITLGEFDCTGSVTQDFGTIILTPSIHSSEACTINYEITDGRGGMDTAEVDVRTTGLLFKDSFETGDTTRWDDVEGGR